MLTCCLSLALLSKCSWQQTSTWHRSARNLKRKQTRNKPKTRSAQQRGGQLPLGSTGIQHTIQTVHKKQKQGKPQTTKKKKFGQSPKWRPKLKITLYTRPHNNSWLGTYKKDKIYETEMGDICIVAASRAPKRDIMVFNTCKQTGAAPITLICAEE